MTSLRLSDFEYHVQVHKALRQAAERETDPTRRDSMRGLAQEAWQRAGARRPTLTFIIDGDELLVGPVGSSDAVRRIPKPPLAALEPMRAALAAFHEQGRTLMPHPPGVSPAASRNAVARLRRHLEQVGALELAAEMGRIRFPREGWRYTPSGRAYFLRMRTRDSVAVAPSCNPDRSPP